MKPPALLLKINSGALIFFMCMSLKGTGQNISARVDSLMQYAAAEYHDNGVVLIAQKNIIIYEKAFGKFNAEQNIPHSLDDKFRLGSMSKQFTAFIILKLQMEGKLSIDDKAAKYIPEFNNDEKSAICIHDLLTHSSGLADYTNLKYFNELHLYPPDSIAKMIALAPLNFRAGTKYQYSNSNFFLLAQIAEKVTGKSFETLLSEMIFIPAGMKNSGEETDNSAIDKMSSPYNIKAGKLLAAPAIEMTNTKGGGGMYSTAADLFKWSVFLQQQLDEHKTIKNMLQPFQLQNGKIINYSMGWCLLPDMMYHTGHINGFANLIAIDTTQQQTVILLSNSNYQQLFITLQTIRKILNNDADALNWIKPDPATDINHYAGTYTSSGLSVEIKVEYPYLAGYAFGKRLLLRYFSKDNFFFNDQEGLIRFDPDVNGKIISLSSFQDYEWVKLVKAK